MAFDGITTAGIVSELNKTILDGGISRIIQPEKDELILQIKNRRQTYYLLMSANASLPLLYLAENKKEAPLTAPNFCMLLRKHIQGGQIMAIRQPSLERVVIFEILHHDELGDLKTKNLIIELMGKYSNIIFTDDQNRIIDSIKRVPSSISSVREVLPGRDYFIPGTEDHSDPLSATEASFREIMGSGAGPLSKQLFRLFTGLSPIAAMEILYEADIWDEKGWADLNNEEQDRLTRVFLSRMESIRNEDFVPNIVYRNDEPSEFGCFRYHMYSHEPYHARDFESPSAMLREYYGSRERITRIRQKTADLRHVVSTALDRTNKKFAIQEKQLLGTEKMDKFRIYGEMLNTYGYSASEGDRELKCINYYNNEEITVPMDPAMTPSENAQRYFERYNKLKRTAEAVRVQIEETKADREQLESILTAIELAETESDLADIRRELADFGFIQRKTAGRKGVKREAKSKPYRFRSSDGFEILVGKNNYQNDELSFRIASGNDWWFHAKQAPGSHVILRTEGRDVPDRAFEEAGSLAAYYSSKQKAPKVEIDYTLKKNLRKTNGGKPGFVIYHSNYSLMAAPDISGLTRLE